MLSPSPTPMGRWRMVTSEAPAPTCTCAKPVCTATDAGNNAPPITRNAACPAYCSSVSLPVSYVPTPTPTLTADSPSVARAANAERSPESSFSPRP